MLHPWNINDLIRTLKIEFDICSVTAMEQKKQNLINVARRMVAEISREQLPFQDEEGDT